jgi:hypothetical protein
MKRPCTGVPQTVETLSRDFAARLRRHCAKELETDPRGFRERLMRFIRREFQSKRGRPTNPKLDQAARMIEKGTPTREVLRWLVPGLDKVDKYGRYLAAKGLRAALARRRKRKAQ